MILADKIIDLRKKNGWSQEELAARLGVSRQSVSKWESAQSIPDLDRILKMSDLFGVSTDYLLKDDAEPVAESEPTVSNEQPADSDVRVIELDDANHYMSMVQMAALRIARGVTFCILAPIVLILLGTASETEGGLVPGWAPMVIGLPVLLALVAIGVAQFILAARQTEAYSFLYDTPIELAYGVRGLVEKRKSAYAAQHSQRLMVGVGICIIAAVPLFVGGALLGTGAALAPVLGFVFTLIIVSIGVHLIVLTVTIQNGYNRLLEEGDFTRLHKRNFKRNDAIATVYWCVVTAIYLGWSFATRDWDFTWLVWPVAGVFYGAVEAVVHIRG